MRNVSKRRKKKQQGQWGEGRGAHEKARECECGNWGSSKREAENLSLQHLAQGFEYKKHSVKKKMKKEVGSQPHSELSPILSVR